MNITWLCKFFDELAPYELYKIIQLRNEVFVVEQNCVFQDADNKDQSCYHLMAFIDNLLIAYTRLVPPNVAYNEASVGRVVTSPEYRKTGIGRVLMQKSIEQCYALFGRKTIKIGAQFRLKKFYESLGFIKSSDIYVEDGIEHIEMILQVQ